MSESPLRVLLWSVRGSGEHYNGPASFTYRLYSSAPEGRVKVTLAHGWPNQDDYNLFDSQHFISDPGISPLHYLQFIRRGYKWLDEHRNDFDVMHGIHAFHSSVLPAVHAERSGLPAVIFVANHQTQLGDKKGLKGLLGLPKARRQLIKKLSGLIAMSEAINQELLGYGIPEEKIARIPMGVNTQVFHPPDSENNRKLLREEFGWLDLPTLIFVGGVVSRKRPDLLVEAIGLLKRRGLDCQLVVAGPDSEPTYTRRIKDRARELGVSDQVVWFGFTREIDRLFRAANYFSLPSENEGMAAALIEAMASGLPPIVTRISGSQDVVADGVTGSFVRADAEDIANVLSDYIQNPQIAEKQGKAARQRVLESYSNESVFKAYERLFRRIANGGVAAE
jgi:glycosyltransferase involved in cell wall biosynthesis